MGQKIRVLEPWSEEWIDRVEKAEERIGGELEGAVVEKWINRDGKYYYKVKGREHKVILGDDLINKYMEACGVGDASTERT